MVIGEVGLVMDFGQNINHRRQFEAQSSHFNRRQSSIFPFVCFFPCPLCHTLVMHEICCITENLGHDAYAVRMFELEAIKILKCSSISVNKIYEWSENWSLEFKSKHPLYCFITMVCAYHQWPVVFQQTRVPNSLPMGANYVDYEPQGTEVIQVNLQTTP